MVLIGVTGSGKSTFARRHFAPTQVLSSDAFRGMVADDENDQSAPAAAFDALHHVAGLRLAGGRLTVVDATNVQPDARAAAGALARAHDVLPVAIVLDVPEDLCWQRTPAAPTATSAGTWSAASTATCAGQPAAAWPRKGFRKVHVLRGPDEIDAAEIDLRAAVQRPPRPDRPVRHHRRRSRLPGRAGDRCCASSATPLRPRRRSAAGHAAHPEGRTALFVGDLVDRGPDTPGVLRLVMGMVAAGTALCVAGNHEDKLLRALRGPRVQVTHGLAESLAQLGDRARTEFRTAVAGFLDGLITHYVLDGGRLVVAHAGLKEAYQGRASGRVRSFCLYGDTTGETDEYGLPVRYPWANDYRGAATVVYGHTPIAGARVDQQHALHRHRLRLRRLADRAALPDRELVVGAGRSRSTTSRPGHSRRPPGCADGYLLDLADVTGRRSSTPGTAGSRSPPRTPPAALEVMGRFASSRRRCCGCRRRWRPCSTSTVDGYLEYPTEAFEDYRRAGVARVVCEEKHMGSRAVALVAPRWHAASLYTRTGRAFFPDDARQRRRDRRRLRTRRRSGRPLR